MLLLVAGVEEAYKVLVLLMVAVVVLVGLELALDCRLQRVQLTQLLLALVDQFHPIKEVVLVAIPLLLVPQSQKILLVLEQIH